MEISQIREQFLSELRETKDSKDLDKLRLRYLGRKGILTLLLRELSNFPPEDRKKRGYTLNTLKKEIQSALEDKSKGLAIEEKKEGLDLTLPGRCRRVGSVHPLTKALSEIVDIFVGMGFEVVEGPEVEWDYYNFEALNIPPYHPARDTQATLFVTDDILLRTHTSPVQIRTMKTRKPPLRILSPGKVYRRDPFDASHSPAFHQIEGLYVTRRVSIREMLWTLREFLKRFYSPSIEIRFMPSYFPFTEPSAEVQLKWRTPANPDGEWLEVLGCGMVHPQVFRSVGYDPEKWKGYAFGLGLERLVMIKYNIDDIRLFYENDIRFLNQFRV